MPINFMVQFSLRNTEPSYSNSKLASHLSYSYRTLTTQILDFEFVSLSFSGQLFFSKSTSHHRDVMKNNRNCNQLRHDYFLCIWFYDQNQNQNKNFDARSDTGSIASIIIFEKWGMILGKYALKGLKATKNVSKPLKM